ncbi:MAG: hypothetical protein WC606_04480 [Candidatus Absconditabacterales bacterium]|jgi:hypothetical protein
MHRFYDYEEKKEKKNIKKIRFRYRKQDYEFSCGQAVMQMKLERYGIQMTQDEIIAISGDKNLGTSHWEIESGLNQIFLLHNKLLRARISFYTSYAQIVDHLSRERGVIVLFMSHFLQKGFSSKATYPHFALLNHISFTENKVTLVVPSSDYVQHKKDGPEEGEALLSIEEFHHRFYAENKYLKRLEYKPNQTGNYVKNVWNRSVNLLFRAVFIFAYYTKILKPGIAIFVEPVEEQ